MIFMFRSCFFSWNLKIITQRSSVQSLKMFVSFVKFLGCSEYNPFIPLYTPLYKPYYNVMTNQNPRCQKSPSTQPKKLKLVTLLTDTHRNPAKKSESSLRPYWLSQNSLCMKKRVEMSHLERTSFIKAATVAPFFFAKHTFRWLIHATTFAYFHMLQITQHAKQKK